jgi:hypothetical protein
MTVHPALAERLIINCRFFCITNLLSAIPFFGQDLVESDITTQIYTCCTLAPSAGNEVFNLKSTVALATPVLPTVGIVSRHALKKGKKIRLDKKDYLSIPYPFIAFLVGLIDGVGYFQITKTTKGFIAIKLSIGLGLEDLSTLEYIHSVLKLGKISIYRDHKNPSCRLIINRTDLQEFIFPLLIYHGIFFLTEARRDQFDLAMFIFKNDIKLFDKLPNSGGNAFAPCCGLAYACSRTALRRACVPWGPSGEKEIPTIFELPNTASGYLKLAFFNNWLVGFTNAEGSFLIKKNNDGCFQLKQRIHLELFEAFKLLFDSKKNTYFEKDKYIQLSLSSKTDIQKVINFFSFSGFHSLIGKKSIQYFRWLTNLRNSNRYKNLNFPPLGSQPLNFNNSNNDTIY